ncbi:unnamed protein product [Pleuronectes platessa]|uniref:Uncharacterized protein n=1 Tax=Pleuronectes platessa TaxID=8262 RepID=A0A9N7VUW8_PLEPL|nr:unnamed protein product [Pleuronectes platessa]
MERYKGRKKERRKWKREMKECEGKRRSKHSEEESKEDEGNARRVVDGELSSEDVNVRLVPLNETTANGRSSTQSFIVRMKTFKTASSLSSTLGLQPIGMLRNHTKDGQRYSCETSAR